VTVVETDGTLAEKAADDIAKVAPIVVESLKADDLTPVTVEVAVDASTDKDMTEKSIEEVGESVAAEAVDTEEATTVETAPAVETEAVTDGAVPVSADAQDPIIALPPAVEAVKDIVADAIAGACLSNGKGHLELTADIAIVPSALLSGAEESDAPKAEAPIVVEEGS